MRQAAAKAAPVIARMREVVRRGRQVILELDDDLTEAAPTEAHACGAGFQVPRP
jgi:hypothetical protein